MRRATWLICAWILWSPTLNDQGYQLRSEFSVMKAYDVRRECDTMATYINEGIQKNYPENRVPGRAICLPDTVDPRAPKR